MRLNVHYARRRVGQLLEQGGRIYFEYDVGFLAEGPDLSPAELPFRRGVYEHPSRNFLGLPGLIYDSLPDRFGTEVLRRRFTELGATDPGPLRMLAFLGRRCMGALSYEPVEGDADDNDAVNLVDAAQSARQLVEQTHHGLLDPALVASGITAGGARPKLLVAMDEAGQTLLTGSDNIPAGMDAWLLKLDTVGGTDCRLEQAYALMARACGLRMEETRLISGPDGAAHFAIRRFDRDRADPNRRIHLHSYAGLFHLDYHDPALDYDLLLRRTRALTRDEVEVREVFRLMLFNVLASNRDDHAKNFSYLMDAEGRWRFAPAYDLVFCDNHLDGNWMLVAGKRGGLTREDFRALGQTHSLPPRRVDALLDEVRAGLARWPEFADAAGVGPSLRETVAARLRALAV